MTRILHGDCLELLPTLEENSVHAIVTDPPYHLTNSSGGPAKGLDNQFSRVRAGATSSGFMGKKWDGGDVAFRPETWREVLRVMRPGAYLLAFGGTRTYHRLVCAIEDAGFEVRDMVSWIYGSGFPKGTNKAKIPQAWQGFNTALKPALEPICLARKPMAGTLAENLEAHGCGALNIGGCRIEASGRPSRVATGEQREGIAVYGDGAGLGTSRAIGETDLGRWPANVVHDGSDEVIDAFPDAPGQCADASFSSSSRKTQNVYDDMKRGNGRDGERSADSANDGAVGFKMKSGLRRGDEGSAARFFYCAKADRDDREHGLDRSTRNHHPTVKPTALMRWLVRLVTPRGGVVLDPFMGSGSTGRAAVLEGFDFIGIEREAEYIDIARARIEMVSVADFKLGAA